MSTPERHSKVGELFLAVCDLSKDDQTTSLDRLCANDPSLRSEVAGLLEQDSRAEDLIAMRARRLAGTNISNFSRSGYADAIVTQLQGYDGRRTVTPAIDPAGLPTIPGFEILGVLGHGGMGIVYRARQVQLGREVALKVLPAMTTAASPMIVERFKREATAAAQLRHRNIVPVYDFGRCDDCYYYAMELVAGAPLNVVIRQLVDKYTGTHKDAVTSDNTLRAVAKDAVAGLPWLGDEEQPFERGYFNRVARWMASVADALHLAHEHGIVHRDIKPGNLMLSRDREIMVTDFGLVMTDHEAPITKAGAIMGTLRYLSPEQALGNRVPIDHRADVYSLGATLYELLTLCSVFGGENDQELLAAVIGREPIPPRKLNPKVPADLETICLKALEKLPQNRYLSAAAFAADLLAFANDRAITARRPTVLVSTGRFVKLHKLVLVGGLAVILLTTMVGLLAGRGRTQRRAEQAAALLGQGLVHQKDHQWDAADETYAAILKFDPKNVQALGNLAIVRKEQFNAQPNPDPSLLWEADQYCEKALEQAPGDAGLWNVKGVILKKLKSYDGAITAYREAITIEDGAPELQISALNNLAEVQWLVGDAEEAEETLREAAATAEATATPAWFVWQDLASLEVARGNLQAVEYIRPAFAEKSEPGWRLYVVRARIYLDIDEVRDAKAALRDAYAALDQGQPDPRVERTAALALLRNGDFAESVDHAEKALALGDIVAFPHVIMAIANASLGEFEQARTHLGLAQEWWPAEISDAGYVVSTERGMLWFDTEVQLRMLQKEAEQLIQ